MDGELWAGCGRFSEVVSTVCDTTLDEAAWRKLQYQTPDPPAHGAAPAQRTPALQTLVQQIGQPWVRAVAQSPASTTVALQTQLQVTVRAGGEGLMLHRGSAHYLAQRSDDLRKFKTFDDAEARVVGQVPGRGKYEGQMGALWLELPESAGHAGRRFKLGTGFSDAERRDPPPVGSWVTYRYRGKTDAGVPRFASFLRRAPESL
jgi:DNA ligase 1